MAERYQFIYVLQLATHSTLKNQSIMARALLIVIFRDYSACKPIVRGREVRKGNPRDIVDTDSEGYHGAVFPTAYKYGFLYDLWKCTDIFDFCTKIEFLLQNITQNSILSKMFQSKVVQN